MLPSSSSRAGGAIRASVTTRNSSCLNVRRLLVASIPPSPIAVIACPSMLLFLLAFLLMHCVMLAVVSHSLGAMWTATRNACPDLISYAALLIIFTGMLAGTHCALVLPNFLNRATAIDRQDAAVADLVRGHNSSTKVIVVRLVALILHISQRVVWIWLLYSLLRANWNAWGLIDGLLEQHKLATQAFAMISPAESLRSSDAATLLNLGSEPSSAAALCGAGPSKHLLRWSLLCIILSSAVAISLLFASAEEMWSAVRTRCRDARAATVRARTMHASGLTKKGARAAAWKACCAACCLGLNDFTVTASQASGPNQSTKSGGRSVIVSPSHAYLDFQTDDIANDMADIEQILSDLEEDIA